MAKETSVDGLLVRFMGAGLSQTGHVAAVPRRGDYVGFNDRGFEVTGVVFAVDRPLPTIAVADVYLREIGSQVDMVRAAKGSTSGPNR